MAVLKPGVHLATVDNTSSRSGSVTFRCGTTNVEWQAKPRRLFRYVCPVLPYRVNIDSTHQVLAWVPMVPSTKADVRRWLRFCGVKSPDRLVKQITGDGDKASKDAIKALSTDASGYLESLGASAEAAEQAQWWLPAGFIPLGNRLLEAGARARDIFAVRDHLLAEKIQPSKWLDWLDAHAFELIDKDVAFEVLDRAVNADDAMRSFGAVRSVLRRKERYGNIAGLVGSVYAQASNISGLDKDTIYSHVGARDGKYRSRFWLIQHKWTNDDGSLRVPMGTGGPPSTAGPYWIASEPISLREHRAAEGFVEFGLRPVRRLMKMGPLPDTFDEAQLRVAESVRRNRITVVLGAAGTGKTNAVRAIGEALASQGNKVAWTATTGRAGQSLNPDGRTVHSYLGVLPGDVQWASRRTQDAAILIIDEASMMDTTLAGSLGVYLKTNNHIERIILVGDPFQLPPVSVGKTLDDLAKYASPLQHTVIELDTIHRTTTPGILDLATAIRNRQPLPPISKMGGVHVMSTGDTSAADLVRSFVEKFLAKPRASLGDLLIITPTNDGAAGVTALNAIVRELHIGKSDASWVKGQRVIQTKNHKESVDDISPPVIIANGTFGTVMDVDDDGCVLVRYDGRDRVEKSWKPYECIPDDGYLAGGYVLSVHRAQGQQAKAVVVVVDSDSKNGPTRMWEDPALGYTAVTRAQHSLTIIGDYALLAGDTSHTTSDRVSFLPERIATLVNGNGNPNTKGSNANSKGKGTNGKANGNGGGVAP